VRDYLLGLSPLPNPSRVTLFVLDEGEWRRRSRKPFGLAALERGDVLVPLSLSERALFALLRAFTRAGVSPPGPVTEALDLVIGERYVEALLMRARPKLKSKERQVLASGLWLFALKKNDPEGHRRLELWAKRLLSLSPKGRGLADELALVFALARLCLPEAERCAEVAGYPEGELRAMLEPWLRSLPPAGSPATPSRG